MTIPMRRDNRSPLGPPPQPLFLVLSGLSGVGKDTVLAGLRQSGLPVFISVSATTRARRAGEKDGFDYHFVSAEKFQSMVASGELLEWATVYGNSYGIPKEPLRQALKKGSDVLVKIDVQGAATIKKILPQAVFIFLVTSTLEELEQRLKKRRTETPAELELRLNTARQELEQIPLFDYCIVNRQGEIAVTVEAIKSIITAEKCRIARRDLNF
jgi:guanylate kinase